MPSWTKLDTKELAALQTKIESKSCKDFSTQRQRISDYYQYLIANNHFYGDLAYRVVMHLGLEGKYANNHLLYSAKHSHQEMTEEKQLGIMKNLAIADIKARIDSDGNAIATNIIDTYHRKVFKDAGFSPEAWAGSILTNIGKNALLLGRAPADQGEPIRISDINQFIKNANVQGSEAHKALAYYTGTMLNDGALRKTLSEASIAEKISALNIFKQIEGDTSELLNKETLQCLTGIFLRSCYGDYFKAQKRADEEPPKTFKESIFADLQSLTAKMVVDPIAEDKRLLKEMTSNPSYLLHKARLSGALLQHFFPTLDHTVEAKIEYERHYHHDMPEETQILIETGRPKALKDTTASTNNTERTYQSSVLVNEYYKKLLLGSEQSFTTQDTKHMTAQVAEILATTKSGQLDLQAVRQLFFEYGPSQRNTIKLLKSEPQASNSQSLAGTSTQFTIPSSIFSSKDNDSAYTKNASQKDEGRHPTFEHTESAQAIRKSPGFSELMHQGMQTSHWSTGPNWTYDKGDCSFKSTNTSSTKEHRPPINTSENSHVNTTTNTDTISGSSRSWGDFFSGWGFGSAASSNNDSANISGVSTNNDRLHVPFALSRHERFIHSESRGLLNQEPSFGFDHRISSLGSAELGSRHVSDTLSSHDLSNPLSAATHKNREVSSPSFTSDADNGTSRGVGSFNATDTLSSTNAIHTSSFSNHSSGSNLSSFASSSQRFTSHASGGLFNQERSSIFDSHDSNTRGLRISPTGGVDTSTGAVNLGFSIRW